MEYMYYKTGQRVYVYMCCCDILIRTYNNTYIFGAVSRSFIYVRELAVILYNAYKSVGIARTRAKKEKERERRMMMMMITVKSLHLRWFSQLQFHLIYWSRNDRTHRSFFVAAINSSPGYLYMHSLAGKAIQYCITSVERCKLEFYYTYARYNVVRKEIMH